MPTATTAAAYPHIARYRAELDRLFQFGGSANEQSIRRAFENCLADYCAEHKEKLALVPELRTPAGVIPDGTVKDSLRMARGYWEAKDSQDNLDAEIQRKFNRGYPRDNIIFEDSQTAVLIQNQDVAMRVNMSRPGELHRLIKRFLDYELPEIEEFRHAQRQFKADLPSVLDNLRQTIAHAGAQNPDYQAAAAAFLAVCHQTISPNVSSDDVREMLLQHILTKDIFLRVFAEDQFHRENNIAQQLDALERTFFTGDVRRQAIDRLRAYYGAIGRAADEIADYAEKQQFLKTVYEDFYKAYNPAAADRLGVVYTPNEVVDFIIRGADYLLQKHFNRTLADKGVQILDPATGTGTFITNLINHLPQERLAFKYLNEMHANEVAILPYYIANLNIEYTYKERMGAYKEFPNLVFVDTLDNMDWQGATGGAVQRQSTFELGGISAENWVRLGVQNEKPISVIIGNPPYNAHQTTWNDNNPNRPYPEIDRRIKETYVNASTAQNRNAQYDVYKRFIRWASDRLDDDGIIAFITNRAFLDSRQDDGFRKVVSEEFNELWAIDLKGNARTSGERRRREGGNIFDDKIRVGVAIYFLVRRKGAHNFRMFYNAVDDYAKSAAKIEYIRGLSLNEIDFTQITPDAKNNWLNQSNSNFERLMPLADPQTKHAKIVGDEKAVFKLYSNGVKTHRDEWMYDFDVHSLTRKVSSFINEYEKIRIEHGGKAVDNTSLGVNIRWSRELKRQLLADSPNVFDRSSIRQTLFRPFVNKFMYFHKNLNDVQYQLPEVFPNGADNENKVICFCVNGKSFYVLAADKTVDVHFAGDTQCLPLYRYTDEGERVLNITEWGIARVNAYYRKRWGRHFEAAAGGASIGAEDIFAYAYAVLHDPVYRHDYQVDLLREFPRLPLYADFDLWAKIGHKLLDLHIDFMDAAPYPLQRADGPNPPSKVMLRANAKDKEQGVIRIDDQTALSGIPPAAWRYRLGSRSALEWILDQHKERKPRDAAIRERFDAYRFAAHKERVIDLLMRVCTVSVATMDLVDDMAYWRNGRLLVFGDREEDDLGLLSWAQWFNEPEDEEWLAQW